VVASPRCASTSYPALLSSALLSCTVTALLQTSSVPSDKITRLKTSDSLCALIDQAHLIRLDAQRRCQCCHLIKGKGLETRSKTLARLISTPSNQDCQRRLDNPRAPHWPSGVETPGYQILPDRGRLNPRNLLHALSQTMRPAVFERQSQTPTRPRTTRWAWQSVQYHLMIQTKHRPKRPKPARGHCRK
jgi:hypothetical protein